MLSKSKRLNLKKDFKWVASGEKISFPNIKIFYRFGDVTQPQVGIAVSSSTFKKAVDRNRARRVVSKAFEDLYPFLPKQIKIIALPLEGVLKLNSTQVWEELKLLLLKRNLLEND